MSRSCAWRVFVCFFSLCLSSASPSSNFLSSVLVSGYDEPPPCSLNGYMAANGTCICDKPWTGSNCETLQVLPVSFPQGFGMAPKKTVWGSDILFRDGLYHLFASSMSNGSSLRHWVTHSQIEHAVSKSITGPFVFQDVAVPRFSHNPKVIELQDGKLALIHIGMGEPRLIDNDDSKDGMSVFDSGNEKRKLRSPSQGSTIHTSDSPYGPWIPLQNNTLGNCNNPAPFVVFASCEKSHVIYIVCSHAGNGVLKRAERIEGPWETVSVVTPGNMSHHERHKNDNEVHYEDPSLYIDRRGFHIIYHAYIRNEHPPHGSNCTRATVSKYLFSQDGLNWHIAPGHPFGTQFEVEGKGFITAATRERPSLFFEPDSSGQHRMTHLVTSVCGVPNCPRGPAAGCVNCKYDNWDYTLVQPLVT